MACRLIPFVLLSVALPTCAETLPDPTRPAMATAGESAPEAAATAGPRLQMIRIAPSRRTALIDGQEVTVGSMIGELRVVRITEGEVVLKGPGGKEVLKLFSDVEKRPISTPKRKTDARAPRKAQP